ncbi:DCAF8 [Cordylochernes scorpioides]|uniref:DCAF8 n=1 Tax=Cordylochernes scorpioides TaxID=51811 RepID=A0ABY6K2A9_9ARAC|nr:DCAF8 [Cordylochernes scorpioides]
MRNFTRNPRRKWGELKVDHPCTRSNPDDNTAPVVAAEMTDTENKMDEDCPNPEPAAPSVKHPLGQVDEGEPSGKVMKKCNGIRRKILKDDSGIGTEKSREDSSEDEYLEFVSLVGQGDGGGSSSEAAPAEMEGEKPPEQKSTEKPAPPKRKVIKGTTNLLLSTTMQVEEIDIPDSMGRLDSDDDIADGNVRPGVEIEYDPTPKCPKPKHDWFLCREVVNRQYGFSNRIHDGFRQKCCSSLHMVERLELMYKMSRHNGCVNALHFNSSGDKLASGSDDLSIIIWDWTISKPLLVYDSGHRSNIFQAKFMPHSNDGMIVSCGRDGQVRVGEISSLGVCTTTRRLAQHKGSAHKLAIHEDTPKHFLSCGEDGWVFEIDIRQPKHNKLVLCKEGEAKVPLYSIHRNPQLCTEFAVGGKDHFARVYDSRFIRDGKPVKSYTPHHMINWEYKANVTCLVYNYNGTELLVSYNDEDIYLFNTRHSDGADFIHRYKGHRNNQTDEPNKKDGMVGELMLCAVKGVNFFGPKSNFIVSGSDCGYIYFWDKESEHIVQSMAGDEGGVIYNIALLPAHLMHLNEALAPCTCKFKLFSYKVHSNIGTFVGRCQPYNGAVFVHILGQVNVLEPHPTFPFLATSGLDDDIKIWVPSCENSPNLTDMPSRIISNMKEREEDRKLERNEPDAIDGQMIWFLMQHLRRTARRRVSSPCFILPLGDLGGS